MLWKEQHATIIQDLWAARACSSAVGRLPEMSDGANWDKPLGLERKERWRYKIVKSTHFRAGGICAQQLCQQVSSKIIKLSA